MVIPFRRVPEYAPGAINTQALFALLIKKQNKSNKLRDLLLFVTILAI
jgi:hypothetical protein